MPITLLALVAVVFALVLLGGHLGPRGLALLLLLCVVVFTGLFTVRTVSVQRFRATENEPARALVVSTDVSTEKMWEHLNRPKIDLSDETKQRSFLKPTESADSKLIETKSSTPESAKKPDWVGIKHHRVGNVLRKVVVSDPYAEVDECYQSLQDGQLREIVGDRLDELAANRYRPTLERLGLGPSFIWRDVCREEWIETLETSVGEMKRVHVLLEFDASVDKQLQTAYRNYERKFRIQEVGGLAGLALGSIALLLGLLKVDTWTKGYYTKRLYFGVSAAIIAIVALFC